MCVGEEVHVSDIMTLEGMYADIRRCGFPLQR